MVDLITAKSQLLNVDHALMTTLLEVIMSLNQYPLYSNIHHNGKSVKSSYRREADES